MKQIDGEYIPWIIDRVKAKPNTNGVLVVPTAVVGHEVCSGLRGQTSPGKLFPQKWLFTYHTGCSIRVIVPDRRATDRVRGLRMDWVLTRMTAFFDSSAFMNILTRHVYEDCIFIAGSDFHS